MAGKKKPRTVDRLCGTGDAMTIKYMVSIAPLNKKIKGGKLNA